MSIIVSSLNNIAHQPVFQNWRKGVPQLCPVPLTDREKKPPDRKTQVHIFFFQSLKGLEEEGGHRGNLREALP